MNIITIIMPTKYNEIIDAFGGESPIKSCLRMVDLDNESIQSLLMVRFPVSPLIQINHDGRQNQIQTTDC